MPPSFSSPAAITSRPAYSLGVRDALRIADLAPDHAHGRHARERQKRRQREAEQQHEAHRDALHRGPERRRRQFDLDERAEPVEQDEVAAEAEHDARHAA